MQTRGSGGFMGGLSPAASGVSQQAPLVTPTQLLREARAAASRSSSQACPRLPALMHAPLHVQSCSITVCCNALPAAARVHCLQLQGTIH